MSYTIKPIVQYAVINDDNGMPIAVCKDRTEATAIVNMMAGHGSDRQPRAPGKEYTFSDWAKH